MTIINVRGTSGAGKSTLVKKIIGLYPYTEEKFTEGRRQPIGQECTWDDSYDGKPLYIPGHYRIACGGCDTISKIDDVYDMVKVQYRTGHDVLFEGLMVGEDARRAIELSLEVNDFFVIDLNTPLDVCVERIKQRRAARGNDKPLNEKNTRGRAKGYITRRARMLAAGVKLEVLDADAAFEKVRQLLNV
jgi:thymidylate kinase